MKSKYLLGSLVLVLVLVWGTIFSLPDKKLHLVFCDVGQGDAILIIKGTTQILVDGGPNDKVLSCLSRHLPFWDKELEVAILTHPESDHMTGLVAILERYRLKYLISNSLLVETGVFSRLRQQVIDKKISVFSPKHGDKIRFSSLELWILLPKEKLGDEIVWKSARDLKVLGLSSYKGNLNDTAIVAELNFGQFNALLTGDIGTEQEEQLIGEINSVDVLKIAHHGSKYSTSKEFLDTVEPKLAVISVGSKNRYGHPAPETLERLKELKIKILRTDLEGEIEIVSDGKSWKVLP